MIKLPEIFKVMLPGNPYPAEMVHAGDCQTYGDQRAAEARADALQSLERVPMTDAELIDILTPIGAAWLMDEADECSQINAIRAIAEAARMKD